MKVPYYVYAVGACVVVSVHLFTLKMISYSTKQREINRFLAITIVSMLLSRWLIYKAMQAVDNPTLVHIILNFSIFFTLAASMLFLDVKVFDVYRFGTGLVLIVAGMGIVQLSYSG